MSARAKDTEKTFSVKLVRSLIGCKQGQRETARLLGLRRMNAVSTLPDRPEIRGMVRKINHLVEVQEGQ